MNHDRVFLGLGANLGRRADALARAREMLAELPHFTHLATSQVYATTAQGEPPGPPYLNLALAGWWRGTPEDLLSTCQGIETRLGRTRPYVNAPRTIDIDLLFWEGRIVHSQRLSVPHPRLCRRAFALVPLLELEPGLTDGDGRPLAADLSRDILAQGIRVAARGDLEESIDG